MPLTNAQKQAEFRERQSQKMVYLGETVEALKAENAELVAKLERSTAKIAALQKKLKTTTTARG